ncbi:MAG: response regulator [Eubacteriales bacterium]|nr:response regulator [Eubacteriales bacterium]
MYKLLIVDDEPLVRRGFRKTLTEQIPEISILEEASDGAQALEAIVRCRPDIVLTDIRMPHLDGLALIQRCREKDIPCDFIIISGYNDFTYAQQAIGLGVTSYLLKPVDNQELVTLMRASIQKLETVRERSALATAKETLAAQSILRLLLQGSLIDALPTGDVEAWQHYFMSRHIQVYQISHSDESATGLLGVLSASYSNRTNLKPAMVEDTPGHILLFLGGDEAHLPDARQEMSHLFSNLPHQQEEPLVLSYGGVTQSLSDIPALVRKAEERAMLHLRFSEQCCFSQWEDEATSWQLPGQEAQTARTKAVQSILQEAYEDAAHGLIEAAASLYQAPCHPAQLFIYLRGFYRSLFQALQESKASLEASFPESYVRQMRRLLTTGTFAQAMAALGGSIREIKGILGKQYQVEQRRIIAMAKAHMHAHFQRDLTLESVARQIQMSPAYFSHVFKQETGQNFLAHLTELRIEHAKKLLLEQPQLRIFEVAESAGYQDVRYFSRVFKTQTSFTPGVYRERGKG